MSNPTRIYVSMICIVLLLLTGSISSAQSLVVTSDKPVYALADTIEVTVTNPTNGMVVTCQNPYWFLVYPELSVCLDGCGGVLMGYVFDPGEFTTHSYRALDLVLATGRLGEYRFYVEECSPDYFTPHTSFEITNTTPNESLAWGGVKALYR